MGFDMHFYNGFENERKEDENFQIIIIRTTSASGLRENGKE